MTQEDIDRTKYQADVESLRNNFEARILLLLKRLRDKVSRMNCQVSDVFSLDGEEYNWRFIVHPIKVDDVDSWHHTDMEVVFTIMESAFHEGDYSGVNFELQFSGDGGRTYRVIAPANFTADVWVDPCNEAALNERMILVESDADWVLDDALEEHILRVT